ncbi:MAG: hypothetical protein OEL66_03975, partial [Desulfobulbaceae bacterium]|nr:hypothetical protein [Desulfobulbaceae bacterium]
MNKTILTCWPVTPSVKANRCMIILQSVTVIMALSLQLMLSGCETTGANSLSRLQQNQEVDSTDNTTGGGRISLFLNLKEPTSRGIQMQVSKIDILSDETWLPIASQSLTIDASEIGAGQLFLGRGHLPAGQYQRLRFTFEQAAITKENGDKIFLALDSPTLEITLSEIIDLNEPTVSPSLLLGMKKNPCPPCL